MIKSLFDYEDEKDAKPQPPENKSAAESEESIKRQLEEMNLSPQPETPTETGDEPQTVTQIRQTDPETSFAEAVDDAETVTQIRHPQTAVAYGITADDDDADDEIETVALPRIGQIYSDAGEPTPLDKVFSEHQSFESETGDRLTETETPPSAPPGVLPPTQYRNVLQNENAFQNANAAATENVSPGEGQSLTTAETLRQSGMAWSAAIGLFGSILFMMILGWFFDLLTGASPFGIVLGIVIGAGIGFYQFFRTTSQIFKK